MLLERLGAAQESTYAAELADGSLVERTRGRTIIRLQGKEFPTPVTFAEDGELSLLGAMALEDALLAVDPHTQVLIPINALEIAENVSTVTVFTDGVWHNRRNACPLVANHA